MRRLVLGLLLVLAGVSLPTAAALAHPLGNFSINHLTQVRISSDRVDLRYILDQAEIPTVQERGDSAAQVLARKRAEVERRLILTVDGHRVPLRFLAGAQLSHPPGQGGLPLTRVEFPLQATISRARSVALSDQTFPGRVGWKAIVSAPGSGTAVRTDAPSGDPTDGLRSYPQDTLKSPLDERTASFTTRAGNGSLIAPKGLGAAPTTTNRAGDGFAGLFQDAASGKGVLILLLLAAFGWGALHALSPGHGKSMVAAYLVGTRGSARHALVLGATVTITHTIGVFALGVITLALSQYVLPEDLYPWLTLASGLLVVAVGLGVLRSRIRWGRMRRAEAAHSHEHPHPHSHEHGHSHAHDHAHGDGPGQHSHHPPDRISWKGLIGMGASAGLIPCPSALVVLLGAVSQHQVALGLVLILAFSVGLAATMTAIGIAVVYAGRITERLDFSSRLGSALPAVSAIVIVVVGCVLTLQAVPKVLG